MIRIREKFVVSATVVLSLAFVGCQLGSKKSKGPTWNGQMQHMSQDVKYLVPFVYKKDAFSKPENAKTIQHALDDLVTQAHKVPEDMGKKLLGDDPVVNYSLENLQSDLQRAANSFREGHKEYSQSVIKSSIGHCFRCHSMTNIRENAKWDLSGFENLELTPIERVDLLVAVRKYDDAKNFIEKEISKVDLAQKNPYVFEALLRKYLALSLRLQETPGKALTELNKVLNDRETPPYLTAQIKAWRNSLKSWDKTKTTSGNFLKQASEKIKNARRLQTFAYDHAGDVEYLWATKVLHQGLMKNPKPLDEAQAYYLLGQSYEVLDDLASYNLHEAYYEACVRKAPKSKEAKLCYKNLEASVTQGFSGTGGMSVPKDQRDRLNQIKSLM